MPGQPNNVNALKHGARTVRHGIVLPTLARRYRHIQGYVHSLRKGLEAHARKVHGQLTPMIVAEANLACRFEVTASIAFYQVSHDENLPAEQIQSLLKTATWATVERNRCIERLGLKVADTPLSPWDQLRLAQQAQQRQQPPADAQHVEGVEGPAGEPVGDVGGQQL